MRGIAAPAFDAQVLVDPGLGHIVEIEILPVGHIGHRPPHNIGSARIALLVEPLVEAANQLADDLIRTHRPIAAVHTCTF